MAPLCSWSYIEVSWKTKLIYLESINSLDVLNIFINFCICTFVFLHFTAADLSGVLSMPFAASPIELTLEKQADLFGINQRLRVGSLNGDGQNWML